MKSKMNRIGMEAGILAESLALKRELSHTEIVDILIEDIISDDDDLSEGNNEVQNEENTENYYLQEEPIVGDDKQEKFKKKQFNNILERDSDSKKKTAKKIEIKENIVLNLLHKKIVNKSLDHLTTMSQNGLNISQNTSKERTTHTDLLENNDSSIQNKAEENQYVQKSPVFEAALLQNGQRSVEEITVLDSDDDNHEDQNIVDSRNYIDSNNKDLRQNRKDISNQEKELDKRTTEKSTNELEKRACKVLSKIRTKKNNNGVWDRVSMDEFEIKGINQFRCNHCTVVMPRLDEVKKHIQDNHRKTEFSQCPHCHTKVKFLTRHLQIKHGAEENIKYFMCSHCAYRSRYKQKLKNHFLHIHTEPEAMLNKMFKCEQCPKLYKLKTDLRHHIKSRHEEGRYQCAYCPFKSNFQSRLRNHIERCAEALKNVANNANSPNCLNSKRHRLKYSDFQLEELKRAFKKTSYLDAYLKKKLALSTNLSEARVKVWFQNKRSKLRRMNVSKTMGNTAGNGGEGIPLPISGCADALKNVANNANSPNCLNSKRHRLKYSDFQLEELKRAFKKTSYLDAYLKKKLALSTNLSEARVKVWFQNKRSKLRRMNVSKTMGNTAGNGGGGIPLPISGSSTKSKMDRIKIEGGILAEYLALKPDPFDTEIVEIGIQDINGEDEDLSEEIDETQNEENAENYYLREDPTVHDDKQVKFKKKMFSNMLERNSDSNERTDNRIDSAYSVRTTKTKDLISQDCFNSKEEKKAVKKRYENDSGSILFSHIPSPSRVSAACKNTCAEKHVKEKLNKKNTVNKNLGKNKAKNGFQGKKCPEAQTQQSPMAEGENSLLFNLLTGKTGGNNDMKMNRDVNVIIENEQEKEKNKMKLSENLNSSEFSHMLFLLLSKENTNSKNMPVQKTQSERKPTLTAIKQQNETKSKHLKNNRKQEDLSEKGKSDSKQAPVKKIIIKENIVLNLLSKKIANTSLDVLTTINEQSIRQNDQIMKNLLNHSSESSQTDFSEKNESRIPNKSEENHHVQKEPVLNHNNIIFSPLQSSQQSKISRKNEIYVIQNPGAKQTNQKRKQIASTMPVEEIIVLDSDEDNHEEQNTIESRNKIDDNNKDIRQSRKDIGNQEIESKERRIEKLLEKGKSKNNRIEEFRNDQNIVHSKNNSEDLKSDRKENSCQLKESSKGILEKLSRDGKSKYNQDVEEDQHIGDRTNNVYYNNKGLGQNREDNSNQKIVSCAQIIERCVNRFTSKENIDEDPFHCSSDDDENENCGNNWELDDDNQKRNTDKAKETSEEQSNQRQVKKSTSELGQTARKIISKRWKKKDEFFNGYSGRICPNEFKTTGVEKAKKHIRRNHRGKKLSQCPHCQIKVKDLSRHLKNKHRDEKDMNYFRFKSKHALNNHILHHMEKRYQCAHCPFKTSSKSRLRYHMEIHMRPEHLQTHKCPLCSFQTKYIILYKRHTTRKHTRVIFQCDVCGYTTRNNHHLRNHMIHHKEVKDDKVCTYRCDKCNYKTYRQNNFRIHKLNHMKPAEIEYFYCYHCSFKAKRKDNLKIHIFKHFKKDNREFACFMCNFTTKKRHLLIQHIDEHSKKQQDINS